MQGLFSEPWMSANCGLQSPWVSELPYAWEAPLPLSVVVPPSLAVAMAAGATAAETPTMETATAAEDMIFLNMEKPFWITR
ncbi:hypothetical protein SCALM49S_03149 [Streptomyces californicus]